MYIICKLKNEFSYRNIDFLSLSHLRQTHLKNLVRRMRNLAKFPELNSTTRWMVTCNLSVIIFM